MTNISAYQVPGWVSYTFFGRYMTEIFTSQQTCVGVHPLSATVSKENFTKPNAFIPKR